jgi:hypothetical protein
MDLLYFLDERLSFISYFYESTVSVFQETMRKIEAGEPPYKDTRNPEDAGEPAFLTEWQDADAAANITGASCLQLLQSTFHSFLKEYLKQIGQKHLIPQVGEMKQKSWFRNYRALFLEVLGIDWSKSGAGIGLLEQFILTRDDFTHNLDYSSLFVFQSSTHASKYPDSAFADPKWPAPMFREARLIVTREVLEKATAALRRLCEYLDGERLEFLRRHSASAAD